MGAWGRSAAAVALAVVVVVSACGGDDDGPTAVTAPAASPAEVRVVSQNLLHGIACAPETEGCALAHRVALFARQLDEAGCPAVVGVQEANEQMVDLLRSSLSGSCDYELAWNGDASVDREVVLTTLPVLGSERRRLAGPLRTALWVRVAADVGVVDLVFTHLASGTDDRPCDSETCPKPCQPADRLNACQARQVVELAEEVAHPDGVLVVAGDLNARRGEPAVAAMLDAGFRDTHLEAGNPECDPETGADCTSGRRDDVLDDLTDPSSHQTERIDYVFVGGSRDCDVVEPTGLFNAGPASPPGEGGLVFPSDHTGAEATLSCPTTDEQREEATSATVAPTSTTTTAVGGSVDESVRAEIEEVFHLLFDGTVTDVEVKLAALEDAERLRPFFLESYAANQPIASQVLVRVDDVQLVDADTADVTFSLLLDEAAVLDHIPGQAVRRDGRWLVSARTYCDVSTQGAEEIPEPCR